MAFSVEDSEQVLRQEKGYSAKRNHCIHLEEAAGAWPRVGLGVL